MILKDMAANGFWAVEIERAGQYEITLRQRPDGVHAPLRPGNARLKIGDVDQLKPIGEGDCSVTFTVPLKAGKTQLQTWLTETGGTQRGAYFVDVKCLSSEQAAP
jgi:hypothetical protein